MAQELGIGVLVKLGMRVLTANGDRLPARFRSLRRHGWSRSCGSLASAETGRCKGRRSYADAMPQTVALAKQLRADE
jgi:hypothetical protein